ncbi:hypothetical protein B4135_3028 [Caldibacillus debilis]|uniref:Uncharacterized protein n=1 Tax=Caldibacillus debilis TaxID=301148 RepID=A0A150LJN6_9BACI|nr:hypothetical protein B4135_3028 [Caldibacillus debilis]
MIGDAFVYAGCSRRVTVGLCCWKFRGTRIVFHPFVRHRRALRREMPERGKDFPVR